MRRTLLRFENLQQIVGGDGIAVILLTDMERRRALSVVCDEQMSQQLLMRLNNPKACRTLLPEVLVAQLSSSYEMMVLGLYDGQYQVALMDENGASTRIRMSDAVLLSIMSHVPLYIEEGLMQKQSVPFDENAKGIAIPINTMDVGRLRSALQHAVDEEDYELASQLRDEIKRRHTEH